MNKNDSKLTFKEVTENLAYVQVWWNGRKVYDDYTGKGATLEDLHRFEEKYNDKLVYTMFIRIVDFHHCILIVEGQV